MKSCRVVVFLETHIPDFTAKSLAKASSMIQGKHVALGTRLPRTIWARLTHTFSFLSLQDNQLPRHSHLFQRESTVLGVARTMCNVQLGAAKRRPALLGEEARVDELGYQHQAFKRIEHQSSPCTAIETHALVQTS